MPGRPHGRLPGRGRKNRVKSKPLYRTKNQEPVNPPKAPKTFDGYERVKVEGGRIELFNGLKSFWLEKFGNDEERLALALLEAMPNLNPNSRTPLEAQIGRILARTVGEKRDRDQRYAAAVVANAARQPAKPKFKPSRW